MVEPTLKEAIKYFRVRVGSFSIEEPLLKVIDKFDNENLELNNYTEDEVILLLLRVVNENIEFMDKYDGYRTLTRVQAIEHKQQILAPLFELRKRIIVVRLKLKQSVK